MHTVTGTREPADSMTGRFDDARNRHQANRAVGVSAVGLAVTGLVRTGHRRAHRLSGSAGGCAAQSAGAGRGSRRAALG